MAIAQTSDGYLWLGTEEGLARFDGSSFTVFTSRTSGLPNKTITALLTARDKTLWIGTNGGGIARYANGKFTPFGSHDGLPTDSITCFYQDHRGRLWIGTDGGGLALFENGHFRNFAKSDGLPDNVVLSLTEDRSGTIWVGTRNGLTTFANGRVQPSKVDAQLTNHKIRATLADRQGKLWIGTDDGLFRVTGQKIEHFATASGLASNSIDSLFEDRAGSIWVGTSGSGLTRFNGPQLNTLDITNKNASTEVSVISTEVSVIFEDQEGDLWAGTVHDGIHCFKEGAFQTFSKSDGLPSETILGTFQDSQGTLWLGSDQGLMSVRDGHSRLYGKQDGLPDLLVFSVAEDRSHNIWAATRRGLARLGDGNSKTFTTIKGLPTDFIVCTFLDHLGNLWIGSRGGLTRYDGHQFVTYTTRDGLSNNFVFALSEDTKGTLWIGTQAGLNRFQNGRFSNWTNRNGLSNNVVRAVYADPDGSIWFGTSGGGLGRFRDGKFAILTSENGLIDDNIFAVMDDKLGHLWLTSNRGIFSISKQQLNAFAEGRTHSVTPAAFGTSDGMKTRECNGGFQPAGWRMSDGRLAFPTMGGVAIVNPQALAARTAPLRALMENITVDAKEFGAKPSLNIKPGRGQLEFHFTAPEFKSPDSVQFRYMLEGFDKDWTLAGNRRTAYYTNIPHGHYRFRVRAGRGDDWRDLGASVEITLQPHFYQTVPFFILISLSAVGMFAGAYVWRVSQLKRREQSLVRLVDERTAALRESERQLRRSRDDLEIRVQERTIELVRANDALGDEVLVRRRTEDQLRLAKESAEQASKAKSEFLTNISHEIRTPINGIIGMTDITLMTELDEEQKEYLGIAKLSAESLLGIVDAVLDFSMIESRRSSLASTVFPVVTTINDVIRSMSERARERNLKLEGTLSDDLPQELVGDAARLKQVLSNLLDNAVKFTNKGTITVTARVDERTAEDALLYLAVSDTGAGIAPDKLEAIFEPFNQADNSSTRRHGGLGLGLTVSSQIAQMMGGKLSVESTVGQGSTFHFTVRLPFPPSTASAASKRSIHPVCVTS